MADGPTPEQRAQLSAAGVAAGLGCSIVFTVVVMIGGGILLDRVLGTEPVLTLVGVVLALAGAGYQLYEMTQIGHRGAKRPVLTRGLDHLPIGRREPRIERGGYDDADDGESA